MDLERERLKTISDPTQGEVRFPDGFLGSCAEEIEDDRRESVWTAATLLRTMRDARCVEVGMMGDSSPTNRPAKGVCRHVHRTTTRFDGRRPGGRDRPRLVAGQRAEARA